MLAIPALDIRDGRCPPPPGGEPAPASAWLDDPVQVARRWIAAGFTRLHLADRDVAVDAPDSPDNGEALRAILRDTAVPVQVLELAGEDTAIDRWLADGAEWVVVGARAFEDPAWLAEATELAPGRIIPALEVRDRRVGSRGWRREARREILDLVAELSAFPLGGLLVSARRQEGRTLHTDLALFEDIAAEVAYPVVAWDCAASLNDLRNLEACGVAAAVLGATFDFAECEPRLVAEEFAEPRSPSA